jgi:hypothetical protein
MTYHNPTKELTTWFLNLPLDDSIDNKRYKIWSLNPRPHEAHLKDQKAKKSQEGHLEKGKPQKPTKDMKSSKVKQNDKEELKKAQKSKKSSKPKQKLKINTPPKINCLITLSRQALPLR